MNRLILALGSNIDGPEQNLIQARAILKSFFHEIKASQIYQSDPVDYLEQPLFLNQVIEYRCKEQHPQEVMEITQEIEKQMDRKKSIPKGPRNIDIDLIFFNDMEITSQRLTVPHPHWAKRSFVVYPLQELPSSDYYLKRYQQSENLIGNAQIPS